MKRPMMEGSMKIIKRTKMNKGIIIRKTKKLMEIMKQIVAIKFKCRSSLSLTLARTDKNKGLTNQNWVSND